MFNKVVLVGNLTRDIELRYTNTGSAMATTSIAVTRKFNMQNGEKREETCFVDITFFGRQAEIANQYLKKGSKLLIEGRLRQDNWQDSQGQNRSKHSIVVENMEMLGERSSQQGQNFGNSYNSYNSNSNQQNSYQQRNFNQQNQGNNSKSIDVDDSSFYDNAKKTDDFDVPQDEDLPF